MSTIGELKVIVEYEDGEVKQVSGHQSVDVVFIDWSSQMWDYDTTDEMIRLVLDADLEGRETFDLIKRLIKKFEEFAS